jgi:alkylhydroperoxidase/carboxymuconolactone decarboxylase family protein YurZ
MGAEQAMQGSSPEPSGGTVDTLPGAVRVMAQEFPELWASYQRLGEQVSEGGPLDERARHLVHLAYAIGANSEGATHSHVRRALAGGLGATELDHVAILAITTLGWPAAVRALTWIRDITRTDGHTPGP